MRGVPRKRRMERRQNLRRAESQRAGGGRERSGVEALPRARSPARNVYLEVGRVIGLHGVRGKIKVAALSGDPSGLLAAKVVRVSGAGKGSPEREYEVVAAHRAGGCAVFAL